MVKRELPTLKQTRRGNLSDHRSRLLLLNASGGLRNILADPVIAAKYERVTEFSPEPVDVSNLPREWSQRYLLFEKVK